MVPESAVDESEVPDLGGAARRPWRGFRQHGRSRTPDATRAPRAELDT
jgi:hypothetical protein